MSQFPVEIRVALSKKFPPDISEVKFGAYLLRAIPSEIAEGGEAILQFSNNYSHPEGGGSHPEEEAINICRLLSLLLNVGFYPDSPDTSIKPIMGQEVCHGNTQEVLSGVQARSRSGGEVQSTVDEPGRP